MKYLNKIVVTTLISGGLVGTGLIAHASNYGKDSKETVAMSEASISMDKAVKIGLAAVPGQVKEVEFEVEHGKSIWEVEVIGSDKRVYELEIDANSGKVLKQELDD